MDNKVCIDWNYNPNTTTSEYGSYCHNCGRGPMSSYYVINGLITCNWCLPENQKKKDDKNE